MKSYNISSTSISKLKELMKELTNMIDTLNYDRIEPEFLEKSIVEYMFKEINKLYSQFDINRNIIRFVNRVIFPNILKQFNKINERCKNDRLKVKYIRKCMIRQVLTEICYLYNLCESKPFDYEIRYIELLVIPKCLKMFNVLYKNFGELGTDNYAVKEEMSLVMKDNDYHGHLSWATTMNSFFFVPHTRKKPKDYIDAVCGPEDERLIFGGNFFASCLDGFHILHFLNNFQLEDTEVITLQYIKSIALYTALIKIPIAFVNFFFTEIVDDFLRSLLVYFQYYLQLWEVAKKRAELRKIKLPHTNSEYYESIWQNNLNDLRYFIARNYCAMILGVKDLVNFHHFKSPKGINTTTDYLLYELLYDFSAKIVLIVLNNEDEPEKNSIIRNEINRLFREKVDGNDMYFSNIEKQERRMLEGKFVIPREWKCETPCLTEVKRPGRDERIFHIGTTVVKTRNLRLRIFQAALLVPDECLKKANIRIGILGKPKKDYPPLLTCRQIRRGEERRIVVDEKQLKTTKKQTNMKKSNRTEETINDDSMKTKKYPQRNAEIDSNQFLISENNSVTEPAVLPTEVVENQNNTLWSEDEEDQDNEEIIADSQNNKTKFLVAIELFTLLLYMKKERSRQKKHRRFIKKMKKRYEAENIVGGDGTYLVEKEYPSQPYCLCYKLLNKIKTFDRDEAVTLWTKYSCITNRFFYRIDPYSSIVDDYFDK